MRRWNGWGDDAISYPIPASAISYLNRLVGIGTHPSDCGLQEILPTLPKSKLSKQNLISADPLARFLHARGQSFPDWVDLHSGHIHSVPDGVAYPSSEKNVIELIHFANQAGIHLIPYGGGTSVVGHINPVKSKSPVLTVDMSRMNRLIDFDSQSLQATFGAGICGPDLEAQLRARGFTLGHFPQSFEFSTLGGWIATRSSGQQSLR
jgi:alkyldihydroxyacetonephosphate synthase